MALFAKKPRLGDQGASSAELRKQAAEIGGEIAELRARLLATTSSLETLLDEPDAFNKAGNDQLWLNTKIGQFLRKQSEISAGIPAAEQRECVAAFEKRARDHRRNTATLARQLTDYPALIAPVVALIEALKANHVAGQALRAEGSALGVYFDIPDAEYQVRSTPGTMMDEVTEERGVWVDESGKVVSEYTHVNGQPVRRTNIKRERQKFVVRESYQNPPNMPQRLADAVKLPALNGTSAWPIRPAPSQMEF